MKIQVYHVRESKVTFGRETEPPLFPRDHELVAEVEVPPSTEFQEFRRETDLDLAFKLTNTINRYWPENDGITIMRPFPHGVFRSTSVGDVLLYQGSAYRVAGLGFELDTKWEDIKVCLGAEDTTKLAHELSLLDIRRESVLRRPYGEEKKA